MNRIAAGYLRHSVELHDVPGATVDDFGQPSPDGALIGTFRARITPLRGRMLTNARANYPTATHRVELPWLGSAIPATTDNPNGEIVPTMYLVYRGRRLDIVFAGNVDENDLQWDLTCTEKVVV